MKKIIEFFKNLFGSKWEYIPTDYAKPYEKIEPNITEKPKKRLSVHASALVQEPVSKKPRKKSETKNKTLKKIETKKPVNKTAKKKK
jgi:hypothetical protein